MSARYDLETLLFDDILPMLKANLNTEIALINTEKNDNFVIEAITDNAFAAQSLDDNIDNFKNFVFLMLDDIQAEGRGPATSTAFRVHVMIVSSGSSNQKESSRRMFRYLRALKQCFEKNWDTTSKLRIKLHVEQIPPQDLPENKTEKFKTVGLVISGSFV